MERKGSRKVNWLEVMTHIAGYTGWEEGGNDRSQRALRKRVTGKINTVGALAWLSGSQTGERALLTISHEDNDVAGTVPAFRTVFPFPGHHVVHFLEGLPRVSARLQLMVCGKGRDHHFT